ncbi:type VI secretion system ATPase TssH [Paraburkholderia sp. CNPSo 3076]|uniref:type VI secretion system ATPase TssH n=1 Tax=Paraburkholderia sp. CNPSo 3076 TaxID=2940936 RepID=UPI00224F964F|nr:type VI secretion system ATPase TssH [Paraburkholderia sp. CNPSo 3076]MCX5539696.1 type VI secretion system ATPase TssH [Paraburkholderia sp. CNPSo 3076]
MTLDLKTLVARLEREPREALERAAQQCLRETHFVVELEHWLLALAEPEGGDFACVLPHFGVDRAALSAEIRMAIARFKRGNTGMPSFSPDLLVWLQDALVQSTVVLQQPRVRAATLLIALLENDALRARAVHGAPTLLRVASAALRANFSDWLAPIEAGASLAPLTPVAPLEPAIDDATLPAFASALESATPSPALLDQYTLDLTAEARAGRIDPIVGRNAEIRQTLDILLRRRQNNPLLVGAPGVGKTAVVEGLALRIAAGDVPPPLAEVSLRMLDLALLQAGAGLKGEFERRLRAVIDEARHSPRPVVLFIDEAHTMIGAGGAEGGSDAANLLKPALARGELRTIAATTWLEYKKYFERDPALARRFQLVQIEAPDEPTAIAMLRALAQKFEAHHNVTILDAAIVDAVKLSHRYISARQLPDKAIAVLDTACARVALAQHDTPPQLEAARHRQRALDDELLRLRTETVLGANHTQRLATLEAEHAHNATLVETLEARWRDEAAAVREILAVRARLAALDAAPLDAFNRGAQEPPDSADASENENENSEVADPREDLAAELARLESGLEAIRDDDPMVPVCVDSKTIAAVIASWTGIPVGKMLADEAHAVRTLKGRLAQRIVGQDAALDRIAMRIQAWRAGLADPLRPVGVFLLVGPTGVGKTETAYALADALYGGERNLIVIDLAAYQEAHAVSQLRGAPPGYVGYASGGQLTEAVRRRPYSVVLLDEIEKAHVDVLEAFYNVFDKGVMEDGTGLVVDFRNTVILATSNVGAELLLNTPAATLATDAFARRLHDELLHAFRPAFLARMTAVPYAALDDTVLRAIIEKKLEQLRMRYRDATGKQFAFDSRIIDAVLARCRAAGGAREIDNVLMNELVGTLAQWALE